ncbi:MAG TPA: hypothetical protein VH415_03375 [Nitrososphaeraceae archaeon]
MKQRLSYEGDAYKNFVNSLRSPHTRKVYSTCLRIYLKYNNVEQPDKLLKNDIRMMQANVINYLTSPKISSLMYSTKHLYFSVLKHFYEINDIILNWKKISKYLGENERAIADRAYTKDEIRKMLNYCRTSLIESKNIKYQIY